MKVIVTGVTGHVGEGVLLECLKNPSVEKVLAVSRRGSGHTHPKLAELLVPDFTKLGSVEELCHVTGRGTDGTEQGKVMWARVKGRAENALGRLPLRSTHNFRPGLMTPMRGQKHVKLLYWLLAPLLRPFMNTLSMHEVGLAMIHCVERPGMTRVLEIDDIHEAAR